MEWLIVATVEAADKTTGRISVRVTGFYDTFAAMKAIYDTTEEKKGIVRSIYVKNVPVKEEV